MEISTVAGQVTGTPPLTAVILAGGQARRMGGGDKSLHRLGGVTLLERLVARLNAQCSTIILSANGEPDRFAGFKLPVIADLKLGTSGPLAGILAGMHWISTEHPDATHILTVTADTPFLPKDLVSRLASGIQSAPDAIACVSSGNRRHPPIALWPLSLIEELAAFMAAESAPSVQSFASRHEFVTIDWPIIPYDPFFNINTPEDLAKAEDLVRSGMID